MRKIVLLTMLAAISYISSAQNDDTVERYRQAVKDAKASYEQFRSQALNSYEEFRKKASEDYAAFLEQAWESMKVSPAPKKPTPDPPTQPAVPKYESDNMPSEQIDGNNFASNNIKTENKPVSSPTILNYNKISERPTAPPQPQPTVPIKEPITLRHKELQFDYFGTTLSVRLDTTTRPVHVASSEESSITAAWKEASDGRYDILLSDCLKLRKELNLCDWGYYMLLRKISKAYYGSDNSNDAKLLQTLLLTYSGYKLRLSRAEGKIFIMLPSEQEVYEKYIEIDGERFYFLDDDFKGGSFYVSQAKFNGEQGFSLIMTKHPKLKSHTEKSRNYTSKRYGVSLTYSPNKNLIDFYDSYPSCSWQIYANAKFSDEAKAAIYPVLRQTIAGKSEIEAANILIDFVQTSLDYKTDNEQFGDERSLFAEESLYYPFCDCEDRAILFTTLVRDLLGLKTALLYYPGHLAAAVKFNETVSGDYLTIENSRYTVCDPTYIGASVGMTMPTMKNQTVEVTLL